MKKQKKWKPHGFANGRSEVLVEPLKKIFTLRSLLPWSGHFLKRGFKTSLHFYTTRLSKIYFLVFPAEGSNPKDFKLKIEYIQLPNMKKETWSDGTETEIKFDNKYSMVVSPKPIKCWFPTTGLVVIHCRITDDRGNQPLDKNEKDILVAQRTLSGDIGPGYNEKNGYNVGQIPIIVIDYHQQILINLTWVLTILTGILCLKDIYKGLRKLIPWVLSLF